jgi:hypothetical protein
MSKHETHFSFTHVDPVTGMSFSRSYFLNALNTGCPQTEALLLQYCKMINVHSELSTKFMQSKLTILELSAAFKS